MSNIDKRELRKAAEKHGDDDILSLLDELEAKDKLIDILRQDKDKVIDMSKERISKLLARVAELEAREVKLPKRSVAEGMLMSGFDRQYAEGWCAGNDNAIHEIHVAGIRINGEG